MRSPLPPSYRYTRLALAGVLAVAALSATVMLLSSGVPRDLVQAAIDITRGARSIWPFHWRS